ncbi:phage integrase N-terminal SAM-like domain-containing protein [Candidatus Parcubacteria bacterium]|nr:phage integrase N-terminal SAM-like domain-containing protein [Candidatus Parcubacteria bacterium]
MKKSHKSIIDHIPLFLKHLKKEDYSGHTEKNYKRYLNRFILWLKKIKKETLKPHELTADDIKNYKFYLSVSKSKNEKTRLLKLITQNYYLIALRAILSYFTAKDIVSLPADKIKLPKNAQDGKTIKFLNLNQVEQLLMIPDTKIKIGLRDRVILELLIFNGFKLSKLVNLNRNAIKSLSKRNIDYVKQYLKSRKDKKNALLVRYSGRKDAESRLTPRSIERIINKYGEKIGLNFRLTPEILRKSYALGLLEEQKKIKIYKPQAHEISFIKNYDISIPFQKKIKNGISPAWNVVESIIEEEINWLKNNISVLPERYKKNFLLLSDALILRKIAILIVNGRIRATEFNSEKNNLWNNCRKKSKLNKINRHGKEWHKKMMNVVYEYFKLKNYKVAIEPTLNYGRADLGIYSNSKRTSLKEVLYIEIGTVSLYKLWYNLSSMKNVTFLIIPSKKYAIEFKI